MKIRSPKILEEHAQTFLSKNRFDLYIVDSHTTQLIPDQRDTFLVKSPISYKQLPELIKLFPSQNKKIIAIGAGSAIDLAKYLASETKSCLSIVPSALSTNTIATNRSSFFDNIDKISFETTAPDTIILDYDLLKTAGILNTFGVIELASTATAQVDWYIAKDKNQERLDADLCNRASLLINRTIFLLEEYLNIDKNLRSLFECLLESGLMTQTYGNGRPVSGSEHIVSSYIENAFMCPHGVGLYWGILIARTLQKYSGYSNDYVERIIEKLHIMQEIKKNAISQVEKESFMSVLSSIKARQDRYTVLDVISIDQRQKIMVEICDSIFNDYL